MSLNAYEIRHSILEEARTMLFDIWQEKCHFTRDNFFVQKEIDHMLIPPEMPPAPTFEQILELAQKMNSFVSNGKE